MVHGRFTILYTKGSIWLVSYSRLVGIELANNIKRKFLFSRFKQTAMRISSLLKDRPRTPLQEACDWIEYVLRHGGAKHLRPQVFYIPWYQYYLFDAIAFNVTVIILVAIATRLICRFICPLCCMRQGSKENREWNESEWLGTLKSQYLRRFNCSHGLALKNGDNCLQGVSFFICNVLLGTVLVPTVLAIVNIT